MRERNAWALAMFCIPGAGNTARRWQNGAFVLCFELRLVSSTTYGNMKLWYGVVLLIVLGQPRSAATRSTLHTQFL